VTRRYTKDHEWIESLSPTTARVGITHHAQDLLGDIVFVELPAVGKAFLAGAEAAVVESVKAASEVYMPLSGTITAINEALISAPDTINRDPEGEGWFFDITLENPSDLDILMSQDQYQTLIQG
jgi:glycine cleavage system H protein